MELVPTVPTFDVIICGAGSGGGFLAGEIAQYGSVLILDAGPFFSEKPNPGVGTPERRKFSTQINLGTYFSDGSTASPNSSAFYAYPMYMDASNPALNTVQREPRVVGGGSFVNVGAWVRPRLVDWDGFVTETGVQGWTKAAFEPYYQKAEGILSVHRDVRANWNKASVLYEQAAKQMGIPVFETASNRKACIFCGHRLNAGMPCKYDSLMSTAITQIPKAISNGAVIIDKAEVTQVLTDSNNKATGVTYRKGGQTFTVNANKLVVLSAGAIGTPILMRTSGFHLLNDNVGRYLRAHPGIPIDAILPGTDWNQDRGYQWNAFHYTMDQNGQPMDAIVHVSAGFPANTPWVASAVGTFGYPYKNLMRQFTQRAGAFIFQVKPAISGHVVGDIDNPIIYYPIADTTGNLEPKTLNDLMVSVKQVASVYKSMGAVGTYPKADDPDFILKKTLSQFVTSSGALHPQGTCRAGANKANSVVDTNCMSWDVGNLMCCDASVIPNHISANPNATIMAVAARASDYVITHVLGKTLKPSVEANVHSHESLVRSEVRN